MATFKKTDSDNASQPDSQHVSVTTFLLRTNPATGVTIIAGSQGRPLPEPVRVPGFNNTFVLTAEGAHMGYQAFSRD
jgi:hypothetical protein